MAKVEFLPDRRWLVCRQFASRCLGTVENQMARAEFGVAVATHPASVAHKPGLANPERTRAAIAVQANRLAHALLR